MSSQIIKITDEAQWLAERVKDVTSTEVSALFDLSPYMTAFELYHNKSSGQVVRIKENDRMKWGKRFEAPIAYGVAEDEGWKIDKFDVYIRDTETRVGSSFDYRINSSTNGDGILEIKNVDGLQFKQKWTEDEAPEHIELQIQHQMLVSGLKWTALVAMVNGNSPKIIYRDFDPQIGDAILQRVGAFWEMVKSGVAPAADYSRDADVITRIHAQANSGEIFDASADNEIAMMVHEYQRAGQSIDELEAYRKEAKARILDKIGTADKVTGPWGSISTGMVKGSEGKVITQEMVGTVTGARNGYRNFKVNMKKEG